MRKEWRSHLVTFLTQTQESLLSDIATAGCCCSLKELDFSKGKSPNYGDTQVQKLYILRYYGSYVCEYRKIYKEILPFFTNFPISIATIGAGCRPDLTALHFERDSTSSVRYTSYDIVEWYGMQGFSDIPSEHRNACVSTLSPAEAGLNIVMFAKSLSDISDAAFNALCRNISNINPPGGRLVIAYSGRYHYSEREEGRFATIVKILKSNGFQTTDDETTPHSLPEKVAWSSEFPGFTIPENVVSFIKELAKQCPQRQLHEGQQPCSSECDRILSRQPMLKTDAVRYNFVRMSR